MVILCYITALLLFVYGWAIAFYERAWKGMRVIPKDEIEAFGPEIFISVLVPARNEAANISKCINSILNQNYPTELFEIIVIDDHSTDETTRIVRELESPKINLAELHQYMDGQAINSYKKKAINLGIILSKGQLIVTTDADCTMGPNWLRSIALEQQRRQATFVAGPVRVETNGTMLGIFQALDFMTMQGITAAAVTTGKHAMCNGANLAYLKEAFEAVDGFKGIDKIASGDDMLLMHKIAKRYPGKIAYAFTEEAIVSTGAMENWRAFFVQRIRWASKAVNYDDKSIFFVLLLVWLLNFLLIVIATASVVHCRYLLIFLLLLMIKTGIEYPFVSKAAKFFRQPLMKYFPWLQPFHIAYTVVAGLMGRVRTYEWKGRQVR